MKETKTNKHRKRICPALLIVAFLLLLMGIRWFMQSDLLFEYLRTQSEIRISENLNGEIKISKMEGRLWSDVLITGVQLYDTEDLQPLATLDTLSISWSLSSLLLRRPLEISHLHLLGFRSERMVYDQGVWNLQNLFPAIEKTDSIEKEIAKPEDAEEVSLAFDKLLPFSVIIHNIRLAAPKISISAPEYLTDKPLTISEMEIRAQAGQDKNGFFAEIHQWSLRIEEPRLEAPVFVHSKASWHDHQLTLEKFEAAGAFSLFETEGHCQFPDLQCHWKAFFEPLSWRDLKALFPDYPLRRNLSLRFHLKSSGGIWDAGFTLEAPGIDLLKVDTRWGYNHIPVLKEIHLHTGPIDFNTLFEGSPAAENLPMPASLENLSLQIEGFLPLTAESDPSLSAHLAARGLIIGEYHIEKGAASLSLLHNEIKADISLQNGNEKVAMDILASDGWEKDAPWIVSFQAPSLNMENWTLAEVNNISASISGSVSGYGLQPDTDPWLANMEVKRLSMPGYPEVSVSLEGVWVADSLQIDTEARSAAAHFLSTALLFPQKKDDESRTSAFLPVLEHPQNELTFQLDLLDLAGAAHYFGADSLKANGRLQGRITYETDEGPKLQSSLHLHGIQYDTVSVATVSGDMLVGLIDGFPYRLDITIDEILWGNILPPSSLSFTTSGNEEDGRISGVSALEMSNEKGGGIGKSMQYTIGDTLKAEVDYLLLSSPIGEYRLSEPFQVAWKDDYLLMDSLKLTSGRGSEVVFHFTQKDKKSMSGYLETKNAHLGLLQQLFLEEPMFDGIGCGRAFFTYEEERLDAGIHFAVTSFTSYPIEFDSVYFALNIADCRMESQLSIWHLNEAWVQSEMELPVGSWFDFPQSCEVENENIEGYVKIHRRQLEHYPEIRQAMGMENITGSFEGFAEMSGSVHNPKLSGEMSILKAMMSEVPVDTLQASWYYNHPDKSFNFACDLFSGGQKMLQATFLAPLSLDFLEMNAALPDENSNISISVHSDHFDLGVFNDLLDPEWASGLKGKLDASLDISGTFMEPAINGEVLLTSGELFLVQNNITLRRMGVNLGFSDGKIHLNQLTAQSNGTFQGSGIVKMNGFYPEELDLRFLASGFHLFNTRQMDIYTGIDLRLSNTLEKPHLSGDISWDRGFFYLDDFGERDIEEVILEEEKEKALYTTESGFLERLEMEVRFRMGRNASLRNRRNPEINLSLKGELDLLKKPFEEEQVFGLIGASSGYVTTFNKRFNLITGNILFSGDPFDPELNIRALYQPRQQYEDIYIYYLITGTLSEPAFDYESEPEMELQDIISYTLFGRPFHALAGWEQAISGHSEGSLATHIAVEVLLDQIETLAADRLGIDVIEIENTRRGGTGGTTIKAGKFLSERLFVAWLQELGGADPGQKVIIEYLLRRNLDLIISAGDDRRSGVDVLWRYDY